MRLERESETRCDTPLASGKGCVADSARAVLVIARNDEAGIGDHVRARVVFVRGGIEVENTPVFLRQAAVPVVAQPGRDTEGGKNLILILNIEPGLVGAIVAIGVALKERGSNKAIGRIRGDPVHCECRKVGARYV